MKVTFVKLKDDDPRPVNLLFQPESEQEVDQLRKLMNSDWTGIGFNDQSNKWWSVTKNP